MPKKRSLPEEPRGNFYEKPPNRPIVNKTSSNPRGARPPLAEATHAVVVRASLGPAQDVLASQVPVTLSALRALQVRYEKNYANQRSRLAARVRRARATLRTRMRDKVQDQTAIIREQLRVAYEDRVTDALHMAQKELLDLSLGISQHILKHEISHSSVALLSKLESTLAELTVNPIAIELSTTDTRRVPNTHDLPLIENSSLEPGCATISTSQGEIHLSWVKAFECLSASLRASLTTRSPHTLQMEGGQ